MQDLLNQLDPDWAWAPFEPSPSTKWDRRLAAHLYRRAGFGASDAELTAALAQTPQEAVSGLVHANVVPTAFESEANGLARTVLQSGDPEQLAAAWVYRLLHTPNQLLEKATVFWHGHFATSAAKVKDAQMMWNQNELLRNHALGEFEPLVQGIARDPAMLVYLDSASNRKSHPNENFARELMELFCLGEGNYSEQDVQELARCFTGWEIRNRKFRKNRYQQDREQKTVFNVSAPMDGERAIQVVLAQPSMPMFICRKLVRYYVCDEPVVQDRLLRPLAQEYRKQELRVAPLLEKILSSNLFFSEHAIARKIRSPIELGVGVMRTLEGTTNSYLLADGLRGVGQGLFYPPNVKGWDGGRAWVNSSTLLGRSNMLQQVLTDENTKFSKSSLEAFFNSKGVSSSDLVDWLEERLLAVPLGKAARARLNSEFLASAGPYPQRLRGLLHTLSTLPEFQLG